MEFKTTEYSKSLIILIIISKLGYAEEGSTPCNLLAEMASSARECISKNNGGSLLNLDSSKDVLALLTDSNRRACMVKCIMEDRGWVSAEGTLDTSGFAKSQLAIPEEMKNKMTIRELQPCLDISATFNPVDCKSYYEFSQCVLRVVVEAFDPQALDCFTKIPAVGPLFALLQTSLQDRAAGNGTISSFFNRMRNSVTSTVGDARSRVSDWIKEMRD